MLNWIAPDSFNFFARYFLAGFIIILVRARYVVGAKPKPAEVIFESVILSLINHFVFKFFALLCPIDIKEYLMALGGDWIFFVEVLALPVVLGIVFGLNLSRGWNAALLRRLSMPIQHPIERAYDYAFAIGREPGFVILTFQDGTQVFGYYGENSLASNDPGRSDIYLERIYNVTEDGQWSEDAVPRSAVISLAGIRSIEFLATQGGEDGKNQDDPN